MNRFFIFVSFVLVFVSSVSFSTVLAKEPIPIIFDTDLGNDVDDTMALAMLHSLESRGELKILAVTSTKDNVHVAPMISAVNFFYGRPDIPIGVAANGITPADGKYNLVVTQMTKPDGQLCFPRNVEATTKLLDAVTLTRKVLAAAEDDSIVVIQVGFFSTLAKLLDTKGDEYSPLDGKELAIKKIKYVSLMAGSFDPKYHNKKAEYNVGCDLPAAKKMLAEWPTKLIFSGFEVGIAVSYPGVSMGNDFDYVAYHPVKEAYRFYRGLENTQSTWDLNSVLYVARPDRSYYTLSEPGTVTVDEIGLTSFRADPNGKHYYQIVNETQVAIVREALIQLTSEPPH